jgi:hypothetical protein
MKIIGKDYIEYTLKELKIPYQKEYKFLPDRKFRFDFYCEINGKMIGIEYDGIFAKKNRHTSFSGFTMDTEKTNLAQIAGYIVLRYTAMNYSDFYKHIGSLSNKLNG